MKSADKNSAELCGLKPGKGFKRAFEPFTLSFPTDSADKMQTVRFTQVVARSGQPEPHTLWVALEQDRELQSALKQHRVMTVHQETTGHENDYGEVGYTGDLRSTLLIFPKSLKTFEGRRVIGVKYDALKPTPAAKPASPPAPKPRVETPKQKPPAPKPSPLRVFRPEEHEEPAAVKRKTPSVSLPDATRLAAAIRQAMKQLQSGKAVAAYQTLEKSIAPNSSTES